MLSLRPIGVLWLALGLASCFPDYQVGEGGALAYTQLIPAKDQKFAFNSNGDPYSLQFSRDFRLDQYEVTVRRYRDWVDDGMPMPCESNKCSLDIGGPYEATMEWDSAWNDLTRQAHYSTVNTPNADCFTPTKYGPQTTWELGQSSEWEDLPMTCVSWFQAVAFCAWDDKRLPTDSEWVYAATNHGTTLAAFPWGNSEPTCAQAVVQGCSFPTLVGSATEGATVDGVQDMVGSVFEWVWNATPNSAAELPNGQIDWSGPATPAGSAAEAVMRGRHGGAYLDPPGEGRLHNDVVESFVATDYYADAGFRCARSVK